MLIKNRRREVRHADEAERQLRQPHPGTRITHYRCSLPGLAEFASYRRERTDGVAIKRALKRRRTVQAVAENLAEKEGETSNHPPEREKLTHPPDIVEIIETLEQWNDLLEREAPYYMGPQP